jgi:invasion protein IalB
MTSGPFHRLVLGARRLCNARLALALAAFALTQSGALAQQTAPRTQPATSAKPDPKKVDPKKPDAKKPDARQTGRSAPGKPATGKPEPASATPAGKPALVATFGDWGVYAAAAGKSKTCYALGQPKDRLPKTLKRDPAYVFISSRPGEGVRNEVSIIMGFDVKPSDDLKAEVGPQSFAMVAKGANLWVKNAAEESQMVDTLKKGSRLVVKAASLRGNVSTDSYSLAGLAQAIDRLSKECQ